MTDAPDKAGPDVPDSNSGDDRAHTNEALLACQTRAVSEKSQTVDHALRVLTVLGDSGAATVAELSRKVALHRSVVQRILATLRDWQFVNRDFDGRYTVGPAVFELAQRAPPPLARLAEPVLANLRDNVEETAVLTVRDGDEAVSAALASADAHIVRASYPVGYRHSLHLAAAGKALLAFSDTGTSRRLLTRGDVSARDVDRLMTELADIGTRGYAVSVNELGSGAAGVSAPVLGATGTALASIGFIAPVTRFDACPEAVAAVMDAARTLEARMRAASAPSKR